MADRDISARWPGWCVVLALGAFVFSTRAWLVHAWGSACPFWDQWDAEAGALYAPFLRGDFHWQSLFAPQNEHRMVLTRLTDLALLAALGRWSIWAELIVNAVLHALTAVTLAAILSVGLPARMRALLSLGIALFFITPGGWHNALWGFQSHFYFSNLLAVLAIGGVLLSTPFTWGWWLGWVAAVLALFSNASGVFTSVSLVTVLSVRARANFQWRRELLPIACVGFILALGALLYVSPQHHAELHARGAGQFSRILVWCMAWPALEHRWLWPILQFPLIVLFFVRARSRQGFTRTDYVALALGLFSFLHSSAIAYSRGAGLEQIGPLSRYQDGFLPGMCAQLYAVLQLAARARVGRLIFIGWSAIVAVGLIEVSETALSFHLPGKRGLDAVGITAVRSYVAAGDPAVLFERLARQALHPSDPTAVQKVLDDPVLQKILPRELATPPEAAPPHAPWVLQHSALLTALSGALFGLVLVQLVRIRAVES